MQKETKIWIPWEKFNEEEIQHLIAMLFSDLGYHIKHLHQSDRANEKGADIVINKDNEEIAIAVKIKPKQNDRPQLMDLSKRNEKKKIYIYRETPTQGFLDDIKNYPQVDFWDKKKLNNFFVKNNMHFSSFIIFDNHSLNEEIVKTKELLSILWNFSEEFKEKEIKSIDKDSFVLLWRLKDSAVVLNQTNNIIQRLFDEPFKSKDIEYSEHFINMFSDYLDILQRKFSSFRIYFENFLQKNPNLVLKSIFNHRTSSHWYWVFGYNPLNDLSAMKQELKKALESKTRMEELDKQLTPKEKREIEELENEIPKGNSVWKVIDSNLKHLHAFGEGIEYVIDDIFIENFGESDRLDIFRDLDKEETLEDWKKLKGLKGSKSSEDNQKNE